ncbi:hypothetical protein Tco_1349959 [Tanacetum coccineum]
MQVLELKIMEEEKEAGVHSLDEVIVEPLLDEVDKQNKDAQEDAEDTTNIQEDSESDLHSMLDDDLQSLIGFDA